MSLTNRAELTFRTEHADVVVRALSPEMSEKIPRTVVDVSKGEGEVTIRVEADDLTSLRAALNSYIRWANVAEETAEEVRK
jgi:KEOPS complex subunit Pcc1